MAETKLTETIRAYLKRTGTKARRLSLDAGLHHDAVRNIFRGISESPRGKTLRALADTMGLPVDDLEPTGPAPAHELLSGEVAHAPIKPPDRQTMPLDVTVLGTAAGAVRGAFTISEAQPIDYVRRPPGIARARNVYALYVVGDSMEPAYPNGALIFVHPDKPPNPGDFVIIEQQLHENGDRIAYIKRLQRRTEKWIFVDQLNPEGEQKFATNTVTRLHRVLTMNELFGV